MNNIIPMIKCRDMKESISFYTDILDFELVGTWPEAGSPSFSILTRNGAEINLSTHSGDGVFGTVVSIIVKDVEELFKQYKMRGLPTSSKKESPVHYGPTAQTWGTTEFYVDDPNGNTLRFIRRE
jgi:catechol 2,3-dioxygenase-like lactoylglutathione lyase family enzyme